jgi:hypothetical protein
MKKNFLSIFHQIISSFIENLWSENLCQALQIIHASLKERKTCLYSRHSWRSPNCRGCQVGRADPGDLACRLGQDRPSVQSCPRGLLSPRRLCRPFHLAGQGHLSPLSVQGDPRNHIKIVKEHIIAVSILCGNIFW